MNEILDPELSAFLEAIRAPIQTALSARDHFAITALAGLLYGYSRNRMVKEYAEYAAEAYGIADAMLARRGSV